MMGFFFRIAFIIVFLLFRRFLNSRTVNNDDHENVYPVFRLQIKNESETEMKC